MIKTTNKLPQMGWNQLYFNRKSNILKNVSQYDDVYFVHSFMADFISEEVREASIEFGSQCVVVAIDGKRDEQGNYKVYVKGGRENTGIDLISWA